MQLMWLATLVASSIMTLYNCLSFTDLIIESCMSTNPCQIVCLEYLCIVDGRSSCMSKILVECNTAEFGYFASLLSVATKQLYRFVYFIHFVHCIATHTMELILILCQNSAACHFKFSSCYKLVINIRIV